MPQKLSLLGGVLFAQVLLVLLLWLFDGQQHSNVGSEPLLNTDVSQLTQLSISDGKNQTRLEKQGDTWLLADSKLPANTTKLENLLDTLQGLKTSWPIATNSSSHARFEVTDTAFQRKLSLFVDKATSETLYIGSSPGFKKSHIRHQERDDVYALTFSSYDAPAKPSDWLDRSLLAVKDVTSIEAADYTLETVDDNWQLLTSVAGRSLNTDAVDKLASALATLKVQGIADDKPAPDAQDLSSLVVDNGTEYTLHLWQDGSQRYIRRSDIDAVFTISSYEFDKLHSPSLESLTTVNSGETAEEAANMEQ